MGSKSFHNRRPRRRLDEAKQRRDRRGRQRFDRHEREDHRDPVIAPPAPQDPLIGSINLTPEGTSGEQFQTEISAYVAKNGRLFVLSSGGGGTLQVTDATDPASPQLLQRLSYGGAYVSTSVATHGDLVAVALTPVDYDANPAKGLVRFFRMDAAGQLNLLKDVGEHKEVLQ